MNLTIDEYHVFVDPIFRASEADIPNGIGCAPEKLQHYVDLAVSMYPGSRYTAIRNWTWIDIKVAVNQADEFRNAGIQAAKVRTDQIIIDNPDRYFQRLTSTFLKDFTHNCLFHTTNTTYILCGPGRRVIVSPTAHNLAFDYIEIELELSTFFEASSENDS